jgi:hypothetical protein
MLPGFSHLRRGTRLSLDLSKAVLGHLPPFMVSTASPFARRI